MPRPDVMVIGQIARDLVLVVDEVPDPGTSAAVRTRREMLGGKGANQAVALSQLGVSAGLLAAVGSDRVGVELVAQARSDGLDVAHVVRRRGADTALIVDVVDRHAHWRYLEDIPEQTLVTEADVDSAAGSLRSAAVVSVQLQQPTGAVLAAIRLAKASGSRVVLDGAPSSDQHRHAILAGADVLRADAREVSLLAGRPVNDADTAVRVGRELLRCGPSLAALAVDRVGNVFVWPEGNLFLPLTDTEVVDTTGAGDAFVAALITALLRSYGPGHAARLAVAAAAATVGQPGGRPHLTSEAIQGQLARIS